jgi:putative spermidine/putrescine transport system permease protein
VAEAGVVTGRMPRSGWFWLIVGGLYFLIPLAATAEFSLKEASGYGFSSYRQILDDPAFRETLWLSFRLAVATIVVSLIIFVPTVYWVHLRVPRVRPLVEFLSVLPFVVPPIVLVVGLLYVYNINWVPVWFVESTRFLVPGYVVLSFPFMFRSLDASFRAIDVHTLTEAAQSLGASWATTLFRVILPNVSAGALSGAFLTLALVMGEFTMANVALFYTFPVYINYIGQTQANPAAALTIISFGITWLAMIGILLVGRRPGRGAVQVAGAR